MVWHETVRKTSHGNAILGLPKDVQKRLVVSGAIKELEFADASIEHVKDEAGRSNPASIWHGEVAIKILANKDLGSRFEVRRKLVCTCGNSSFH
jgi:hypothetical protein